MNIYSFRADHLQDVFDLMLLPGMRAVRRLTILPDAGFPDAEVELVSYLAESEMRRLIEQLDDAHVIMDTFRLCALAENPLMRGDDPDQLPDAPEF